jgi:hypothetical protein
MRLEWAFSGISTDLFCSAIPLHFGKEEVPDRIVEKNYRCFGNFKSNPVVNGTVVS